MDTLNSDRLQQVNSADQLAGFMKELGYHARPQKIHVPELDLPDSATSLLDELHLLADYDRRFQMYLATLQPQKIGRTTFRKILEPFYRKYPQANYLFTFTYDWKEIAFVSPQRISLEPGKTKLRLRILHVDRDNVYHTDLEVLSKTSISPVEQNADAIWKKHEQAFDVERVTKEFFEAYKYGLNFIKDELSRQNRATSREVHAFAQQLLSRLMFLYFVQKKGWLKWKDYIQDKRYLKNLWNKYKSYKKEPDTFYSTWLSSLFFHAFNKKHTYLSLDLPKEIKESLNLMPYLNGGLFTENELDKKGFELPDEIFELLFETDPVDKRKGFLERYNFTIREDTPLEVEVAVDPEMLGKVYESLISEEERGKAGIFYTPRVEIDYMCRLSLVEYLHEKTGVKKTEIIPLVFEPEIILKYRDEAELKKIRESLEKVKIVDPAVGSASFLVGMMNVLVEILGNLSMRIDTREENLFALKRKIICDHLYGVDVKDWAVMVGELRLWLSLVIDTDEKELLKMGQNIYQQPLLPNLTFKMRQGDSLVEGIGGVPLSLRAELRQIPPSIQNRITELMDKKLDYFRTTRVDKKIEIENLENELFRTVLKVELDKLDGEIEGFEQELSSISGPARQLDIERTSPEQPGIFEKEKKNLKAKIETRKTERQKLMKVLEELGKKKSKDYFLWEIDFAEVFAEKDGFDIVISNPPYVRQESIAPPLKVKREYDEELWRSLRRKYKDELEQSVKIHWGKSVKIDRKSDYYVYFYYHGLALLRPGGVFCFINSNSWLDVGYGVPLQEFLLKNLEPLYIIDNQAKRSFKESDVNTVIVAIKRPEKIVDNTIRFVTYKKPFDEVLSPDNLIAIE